MSKVTTIRWRPYPEQKPKPKHASNIDYDVLVLFVGEKVGRTTYYGPDKRFPKSEGFSTQNDMSVTHFALPEDITTEDLP